MADKASRLFLKWEQAERIKGSHAKAIAYEVSRGRDVSEPTLDAYRKAEQAEVSAYEAWMEALRNG